MTVSRPDNFCSQSVFENMNRGPAPQIMEGYG